MDLHAKRPQLLPKDISLYRHLEEGAQQYLICKKFLNTNLITNLKINIHFHTVHYNVMPKFTYCTRLILFCKCFIHLTHRTPCSG